MENLRFKRDVRSARISAYEILIIIAASLLIYLAIWPVWPEKKIEMMPRAVSFENGTFVKMWMPAIDGEGKGIPAELTVEAVAGSGRIFVDIEGLLFWADTQQSIRVARAVAGNISKKNISEYDLVYNIRANASIVGGPSAGAGLAVATIAALLNKSTNQSVAITGTINHDGSIGPAGSILEKANASAQVNVTLLLVPLLHSRDVMYEEQEHCEKYGLTEICTTEHIPERINIKEKIGLDVIEVGDVNEALKYLLE